MQSIHVQIAEPSVSGKQLATACPPNAGMPDVGVLGAAVAVGQAAAWRMAPTKTCSMTSSFADRSTRKPLTGDGRQRIGGGLRNRIEVNPA